MNQYPTYKPTGIDWLVDIPEHWSVKRLKDIKANINNAFVDGPFGSNLKTEHFVDDGDVYVIDSGYITSGSFVFHRDFKTISLDHFYTVNRSECKKDDLIIAKIGANYGMSAILPKLEKRSLVSGNTMKLTVNRKKFSLKYIHYLFLYLKENGQIDVLVKGSAQPALSMGLLNDLSFCIPNSLPEQTIIANYLDSKTSSIDRKIELLTSKANKYKALRRSLINETVCRGLPASEGFTKLKDSGVEWIGRIPEHWEVKRVKEIFRNTGSGTTPPSAEESYYEDFGINWLQTGDLNDDFITETSKKISQKAKNEFSTLKFYPEGSLVIAMYGATIGKMGYLNIKTTTNQACCVLTKLILSDKMYVFYQLLSMKQYIISLSTGGGQPNINQDIVRFLKLVVPPLSEQTAIASYLDEKTAQIDAIVANIEQQITKLTQLSKSLINDVVTGKIKITEV